MVITSFDAKAEISLTSEQCRKFRNHLTALLMTLKLERHMLSRILPRVVVVQASVAEGVKLLEGIPDARNTRPQRHQAMELVNATAMADRQVARSVASLVEAVEAVLQEAR